MKRVKARRDSQYPTKRDHMICKCLSLSITYAATIGGLITITGTSTNLIFAEQFNTYVHTHFKMVLWSDLVQFLLRMIADTISTFKHIYSFIVVENQTAHP